MSPIRRAILCITRNKARYIALFLVFFIFASFISIMMQTHQATQHTQQNVIDNMIPQAIIGWDWDAQQQMNHDCCGCTGIVWPLEIDLVQEIATLPYVRDASIYFERRLLNYDLEFYDDPWGQNLRTGLGTFFRIRGVPRPNFTQMEMGIIEVVAGRNLTDVEIEQALPKALISEGFARYNQIGVGSIIPLRSVVIDLDSILVDHFGDFNQESNVLSCLTYYVEIVGLVRSNSPLSSNLHDNQFIVPNGFLQQVVQETTLLEDQYGFTDTLSYVKSTAWREFEDRDEKMPYTAVLNAAKWNFTKQIEVFFQLHSPDDMMPFKEAVDPMLPEYYLVEFADNYFLEIQHALGAIERNAEISIYITVGATLLIISLLIMIFLRYRMMEIGLYLSAGEKRICIMLQFLSEILLVTAPAMVCAFIFGNIMTRLFSENIILNQLISYQEIEQDPDRLWTLFEIFGIHNDDGMVSTFLANHEISLSFESALAYVAISLGVVFVVTSIASSCVMRLSPKKILMY